MEAFRLKIDTPVEDSSARATTSKKGQQPRQALRDRSSRDRNDSYNNDENATPSTPLPPASSATSPRPRPIIPSGKASLQSQAFIQVWTAPYAKLHWEVGVVSNKLLQALHRLRKHTAYCTDAIKSSSKNHVDVLILGALCSRNEVRSMARCAIPATPGALHIDRFPLTSSLVPFLPRNVSTGSMQSSFDPPRSPVAGSPPRRR